MKPVLGKLLIRFTLIVWFIIIPICALLDVVLDLLKEFWYSIQVNYYSAKTDYKDGWTTFKYPLDRPLSKRNGNDGYHVDRNDDAPELSAADLRSRKVTWRIGSKVVSPSEGRRAMRSALTGKTRK